MKKMIVMAALALFGTQLAKAQFSKGDIMLGGNVNVKSESSKDKQTDNKTTSTSFGVSPKVGLALNEHWMVGIHVGTHFGFDKNEKGIKDRSTVIAPGVFVRNYHMIGSSKFAFFGEAQASYLFGQTKHDGNKTGTSNGFEVAVKPGIGYFVTKRFMIEGAFGGVSYSYNTIKAEPTGFKTNKSAFNFDFPKEFNVGVNFIF